jgi:hypothetical protein
MASYYFRWDVIQAQHSDFQIGEASAEVRMQVLHVGKSDNGVEYGKEGRQDCERGEPGTAASEHDRPGYQNRQQQGQMVPPPQKCPPSVMIPNGMLHAEQKSYVRVLILAQVRVLGRFV